MGKSVIGLFCFLSASAGWSAPIKSPGILDSQQVLEDLKRIRRWVTQSHKLDGPDDLERRARRSALLPSVRFRYGYALDGEDRASIERGHTAFGEIGSSAIRRNDHRLAVEVRWRLADALFHPVEARTLELRRRDRRAWVKLLLRATQVYLSWRRARALFNKATIADEKEKQRHEFLRATAELDALTMGRFGRHFILEESP